MYFMVSLRPTTRWGAGAPVLPFFRKSERIVLEEISGAFSAVSVAFCSGCKGGSRRRGGCSTCPCRVGGRPADSNLDILSSMAGDMPCAGRRFGSSGASGAMAQISGPLQPVCLVGGHAQHKRRQGTRARGGRPGPGSYNLNTQDRTHATRQPAHFPARWLLITVDELVSTRRRAADVLFKSHPLQASVNRSSEMNAAAAQVCACGMRLAPSQASNAALFVINHHGSPEIYLESACLRCGGGRDVSGCAPACRLPATRNRSFEDPSALLRHVRG